MWECGDCGEIVDDFSPCGNCGSSKDRASKTGLSLEDVLSARAVKPAVKPDDVPLKGSEPQKADLPTVNNEQNDKNKSTDVGGCVLGCLAWVVTGGVILAADFAALEGHGDNTFLAVIVGFVAWGGVFGLIELLSDKGKKK